jgi:pSer/pThr/pTyr-binding forkhead associated (FHA) protein
MRDGRTRKQPNPGHGPSPDHVLSNHRITLVIESGSARGTEIELARPRTLLGRGPGVDVVIPDEAMSRQHFAVEIVGAGFRLRDLGSTNGLLHNGEPVDTADLSHGDRVKAGDHEFRFLVEKVKREPRTYVLPD